MFEQIENFMNGLLAKLPDDERAKVDHQIYYDTEKNSLSYMLTVNGTSPHFWMYYPESGWGAVECWIKKDGTMQGAIFHDADIEPAQEFDHAGQFDCDLAEFVRTGLIDEGRLTKLSEGVSHYIVVDSPDDGELHDTFAVKFDSLEEAEKYLNTEENNFRERELLTESEFLATWTKPAFAYSSEEEAAEDGCAWDDSYGRWLEISVDNLEKSVIF